MKHFARILCLLFITVHPILLQGCTRLEEDRAASTKQYAKEIVFYDWVSDMPDAVIAGFAQEYGVTIRYVTYEAQEEAMEKMKAGEQFDIVVLDSQFIPGLVQAKMLTLINYQNVPNFKYISANFRDLVYDPGNRYSIPYNWGTTGLVVRGDLAAGPVTRWDDLWGQEKVGKVFLWKGVERQMMGLALKSLGYSVNSENPQELEAALQKLLKLKANAVYGEDKEETIDSSAPALINGDAVMAVGWSHDVLLARDKNQAITYVLPEDGALLWGDNFVIPSSSKNQETAELFLNYLLRPEVSAQLTEYNNYPTANEKARDFIDADRRDDPAIYPENKSLHNAEIILPLSPAGEQLHNTVWARFLAEIEQGK